MHHVCTTCRQPIKHTLYMEDTGYYCEPCVLKLYEEEKQEEKRAQKATKSLRKRPNGRNDS